jgi:hypothetical protein
MFSQEESSTITTALLINFCFALAPACASCVSLFSHVRARDAGSKDCSAGRARVPPVGRDPQVPKLLVPVVMVMVMVMGGTMLAVNEFLPVYRYYFRCSHAE